MLAKYYRYTLCVLVDTAHSQYPIQSSWYLQWCLLQLYRRIVMHRNVCQCFHIIICRRTMPMDGFLMTLYGQKPCSKWFSVMIEINSNWKTWQTTRSLCWGNYFIICCGMKKSTAFLIELSKSNKLCAKLCHLLVCSRCNLLLGIWFAIGALGALNVLLSEWDRDLDPPNLDAARRSTHPISSLSEISQSAYSGLMRNIHLAINV